MFIFTLGAALFVYGRVLNDHAFPELDQNLLLLLGISNGIYVGSKVAPGESMYRAAERLDIDLKVLNEAKASGTATAMSTTAAAAARRTGTAPLAIGR